MPDGQQVLGRIAFCARIVPSASCPRAAGSQTARLRRGTTFLAARPSPPLVCRLEMGDIDQD